MTASPTIRRQFNQAVFERIVIDDENVGGFYLRSPFKELVGPTMDAVLGENEIDDERCYHRSRLGTVLPAQIEASLREIFQSENRATSGGRRVQGLPNAKPTKGAQGSNVSVLVPPTGFEPVPPA